MKTTGGFTTGRFRLFTWKTSSVGKDKANKSEFCKLKITTIQCWYCSHDSTYLSILRVSANAILRLLFGDCRFIIFIHLWSRLFFCCAHSWDIELNTRGEIPYLRAPMYNSLYISCTCENVHEIYISWFLYMYIYIYICICIIMYLFCFVLFFFCAPYKSLK